MIFTVTKRCYYLIPMTVLASLFLTTNSHAAGFYISEVGTPGSVGTAGVMATVNTRMADAAWTNPAAMTGITTDHALGGLQFVAPKLNFNSSSATTVNGNDGGNGGVTAMIPSFFAVKKLSERLHGGVAFVVPVGGGFDFGDNFAGRYRVIDLELAGMGLSASLGYKVNEKLSVGGGVTTVHTTYEQSLALRQSGGAAPDGKIKMEDLDDWGYQPYTGITWAFSDAVLLGAVYRAEADVDLEGDLKFRNRIGPTPSADKIKISWDNPQTLEVGLRIKFSDKRTVAFNANWEDWSAFSDNGFEISGGLLSPVIVMDRNFQDTWKIGAAVIENVGDSIYSLGISYESSPVEDKYRTMELPFDETLRLSAGWAWKGVDDLDFSLGATLAYLGEGKIENTNTQGLNFDGEFDTNLLLFLSGTLKYTF